MQPVGDGDFASKREGRNPCIRQTQAAQQELFLAAGSKCRLCCCFLDHTDRLEELQAPRQEHHMEYSCGLRAPGKNRQAKPKPLNLAVKKPRPERPVQLPCSGGTVTFALASRLLLHTLLYVPNV
ncbi:hypothetical protein J1605_015024 [Eschrichtius robustus]|uniref:XIAP-associated factor 1 n=1 Tax=Eschrichtius robustus TaxID=9764 RepID=A0AB34GBZ5_ESCRO|nr:hypothetical protein J1605_015024 [Eschrichtius robustus]